MQTDEYWNLREVWHRLHIVHTLKNYIIFLKLFTRCLELEKNHANTPKTWDLTIRTDGFIKPEYEEKEMFLLMNKYWPEGDEPDWDGMIRSLNRERYVR